VILFRRILDDEMASKVAIQSHHCYPKPSACITSKRKTQLTESKDLEMSNLMKKGWALSFVQGLDHTLNVSEVVMDTSFS
jgi:hypothetical protein